MIGDSHGHYQHNNDRADYVGHFINDRKPDEVIHIGDSADMPSLSDIDKGKKVFQGRTYRADIDSHLEFTDRLWGIVRRQKHKLPKRVFLVGNHEHRITKLLNLAPELEGTIGLDDLELSRYYDEVVDYSGNTPGIYHSNGVDFAHYCVSGVMGKSISGERIGWSLLSKRFRSTVVGHSHLLDYCVRTGGDGRKLHGLSVGCYQDYNSSWAGNVNPLWWRGLCLLKDVEYGQFDLETVSLANLREAYS